MEEILNRFSWTATFEAQRWAEVQNHKNGQSANAGGMEEESKSFCLNTHIWIQMCFSHHIHI